MNKLKYNFNDFKARLTVINLICWCCSACSIIRACVNSFDSSNWFSNTIFYIWNILQIFETDEHHTQGILWVKCTSKQRFKIAFIPSLSIGAYTKKVSQVELYCHSATCVDIQEQNIVPHRTTVLFTHQYWCVYLTVIFRQHLPGKMYFTKIYFFIYSHFKRYKSVLINQICPSLTAELTRRDFQTEKSDLIIEMLIFNCK